MALAVLDYIVIVLYLIITLWVGLRTVTREHLEGYLVNSRKTKLLLLTLSNIVTLIGVGAVVTVVSTAYTSGISYGLVVFSSLILVGLVLAFVAPKIKAFGDAYHGHTLGDFFFHRYGARTRYLFSFLYIFLALLWGALQFVAVAQLFHVLIGVSFLIALILTVLVVVTYASLAGIISDITTDFIQFWIMGLTFLILVPLAWTKAGGITALKALPISYYDPFAFGGIVFFIGGLILGGAVLLPSVHYWQRIYSADSVKTARRSFLWSIPGMFFFVTCSALAGLFAVSIVPGVNPDSALFELMQTILPPGILGLGFAGIIALVMSSVDSLLIGGSATILKDLYIPLRGLKMTDKKLLRNAKWFGFVLGILMALVAFLLPDIVKLSLLVSYTALCFVPAIIGGLFWRRTSAKGAVSSMLLGLIVLYSLFWIMPTSAFLPALVVSTLALIIVSFFSKK